MGIKNTKPTVRPDTGGKKKKVKEATQRPPMQRVLVLKDGRRRVLEWREWSRG